MRLDELITRAFAEAEIGLQFLDANMTNITKGKRGQSRVTFVTTDLNPNQVYGNTGPVGIVIWIPKDVYERLSTQPDPAASDGPKARG